MSENRTKGYFCKKCGHGNHVTVKADEGFAMCELHAEIVADTMIEDQLFESGANAGPGMIGTNMTEQAA